MIDSYYTIEDIQFSGRTLKIIMTSMHQGEPDGYIGLPLQITEGSKSYSVIFSNVGHFEVLCEMCNRLKEPYEELEPPILRQLESQYIKSCNQPVWRLKPDASEDDEIKHFVVYCVDYVINILGVSEPLIEELKVTK